MRRTVTGDDNRITGDLEGWRCICAVDQPNYPSANLGFMIEDTVMPVLLTQAILDIKLATEKQQLSIWI